MVALLRAPAPGVGVGASLTASRPTAAVTCVAVAPPSSWVVVSGVVAAYWPLPGGVSVSESRSGTSAPLMLGPVVGLKSAAFTSGRPACPWAAMRRLSPTTTTVAWGSLAFCSVAVVRGAWGWMFRMLVNRAEGVF